MLYRALLNCLYALISTSGADFPHEAVVGRVSTNAGVKGPYALVLNQDTGRAHSTYALLVSRTSVVRPAGQPISDPCEGLPCNPYNRHRQRMLDFDRFRYTLVTAHGVFVADSDRSLLNDEAQFELSTVRELLESQSPAASGLAYHATIGGTSGQRCATRLARKVREDATLRGARTAEVVEWGSIGQVCPLVARFFSEDHPYTPERHAHASAFLSELQKAFENEMGYPLQLVGNFPGDDRPFDQDDARFLTMHSVHFDRYLVPPRSSGVRPFGVRITFDFGASDGELGRLSIRVLGERESGTALRVPLDRATPRERDEIHLPLFEHVVRERSTHLLSSFKRRFQERSTASTNHALRADRSMLLERLKEIQRPLLEEYRDLRERLLVCSHERLGNAGLTGALRLTELDRFRDRFVERRLNPPSF